VPQHRSSYSELSANVAFFSSMRQEAEATATRPTNEPSSSTPRIRAEAYSSGGAQVFLDDNLQYEIPSIRQSLRHHSLATAKFTPPGPYAKRPPRFACYFCRERKIACGRPAEGSADPTCNQCKRRATQCNYPRESLRGQHRRSIVKNGGNESGGDTRANPGDYY